VTGPSTGESSQDSGRVRRRYLAPAVQLAGSLLVLAALLRDAQVMRVWESLAGFSLPWLLGALALKALGVTARELRLWISLRPWKKLGLRPVLAIGYASGLVNNVLPARGGDLLGAALLRRECAVSGSAALAAVGVTSLLEALVFGLSLLGAMALVADRWGELLGASASLRAMGLLTVLTLVAVFGSVIVVALARRLRRDAASAPRPGAGAWLRQLVVDAGTGLGALGPLLANLALAAVQVACFTASLLMLFPALALQPSMPVLAAMVFMAGGAFAALLLPSSYGAGPAAAAVLVLALFGVDEAQALAFAALAWVSHLVPIVALGAWPLWVRLGQLPRLMRSLRRDEEPS